MNLAIDHLRKRVALFAGKEGSMQTPWRLGVVALAVGASLGVSGCSTTPLDQSAAGSFYIGGNLGISQLDPATGDSGLEVNDKTGVAYSVEAGRDFSRHWSVEAFYTDLGSAGIRDPATGSRAGSVGYQAMGISALGYFYNSIGEEGLDNREGLSAFGRLGMGMTDTSTSLTFSRDNGLQIHAGAGLEYGFGNNLAARAEVVGFDTDALGMTLGIVKRFGEVVEEYDRGPTLPSSGLPQVQRVELSQPMLVPDHTFSGGLTPQVTVAPPGALTPQETYSLSEAMPVLSAPAYVPPPLPRGGDGQPVMISLPKLYFPSNSAELDAGSLSKLKILATTMQRNPSLRLSVTGYTDEVTKSGYNLLLSMRRAGAVKGYLVNQGINPLRLEVAAIGENENSRTRREKDRAFNRRVDFKILQSLR